MRTLELFKREPCLNQFCNYLENQATASNIVTFTVNGQGAKIIGTGNGNPQSHTPDKSLTREAFRGLVLAVVQSTASEISTKSSVTTVTITASSPGLEPSSVSIQLLPTEDSNMRL